MEFFKNVNVDWMGKAKYFVALSAILLIAGWTAILKNGGIKYGIDFRGGTLVYVRFAGPAPVDQFRNQLAQRLLAVRDTEHSGILTNFDELKNVDGASPAVISSLNSGFVLGNFSIRNVEVVGAKVGGQLRRQAFFATLYALAGMLVYIAFRFEWVYGVAAVIAVFHDVLITLGFFALFHYEISLTVIAALLTLVGYSMNDTIVIFDRVREDQRLMRKDYFPDV